MLTLILYVTVTGVLWGLCLYMMVCAHVLAATCLWKSETMSILFEACDGQRLCHQLAQLSWCDLFIQSQK